MKMFKYGTIFQKQIHGSRLGTWSLFIVFGLLEWTVGFYFSDAGAGADKVKKFGINIPMLKFEFWWVKPADQSRPLGL